MAPSVEHSTEGATARACAGARQAGENSQEATGAGHGGIEGDLVTGTDVGDTGSPIRSGKLALRQTQGGYLTR